MTLGNRRSTVRGDCRGAGRRTADEDGHNRSSLSAPLADGLSDPRSITDLKGLGMQRASVSDASQGATRHYIDVRS